MFSLFFVCLKFLFIFLFSFKSRIWLLIAPVPVHCVSITFTMQTKKKKKKLVSCRGEMAKRHIDSADLVTGGKQCDFFLQECVKKRACENKTLFQLNISYD